MTTSTKPSIDMPDDVPPASNGASGHGRSGHGRSGHGPSRVVKGLVEDRYRIAARTADLSADEALQLATIAEIGNEQEPIPDAVAYLHAPGTGRVVARYFTDVVTDAGGRTVLVYDVVRLSDAAFRAIDCDAFRIMPPVPEARTVAVSGELPSPEPHTLPHEGTRLRAALDAARSEPIADVLAGVLEHERVLWIGRTPRVAAAEALVLLLPPSLRPALTFQTHALVRPPHPARLTMARQQVPDLGAELTLPRDAARLTPRAREAALALLALAADDVALARAHRRYERVVGDGLSPRVVEGVSPSVVEGVSPSAREGPSLLDGVECLLRLDRFSAAQRDPRPMLRAIAGETFEPARRYMVAGLAAQLRPAQVADAVAELLETAPALGWRATAALLEAPRARGSTPVGRVDDDALPRALAERIASLASDDETPESAGVRTALAACAARHGLVAAFLRLVPLEPVIDGNAVRAMPAAPDSAARALLAALHDLAATDRATPGGATAIVAAMTQVGASLDDPRARRRAAMLAVHAVRRALQGRDGPVDLTALDALARATVAASPLAPSGSPEAAFHALLAPGDDHAARARAVGDALRGSTPAAVLERELAGWIALVLAVVPPAHAVARAVALLDEVDRTPTPDGLPSLGALLRARAERGGRTHESPASLLPLVDRADAATRRDLLAHALVDAVARCAAGTAGAGEVADVCVALARRGVTLGGEQAPALLPALAALRARDEAEQGVHAVGGAARLRLVVAVVEQVCDGALLDEVERVAWGRAAGGTAVAWLWRVALAARLTEAVRPVHRLGELRQAALAARDARWRFPASHSATMAALLPPDRPAWRAMFGAPASTPASTPTNASRQATPTSPRKTPMER